MSLARVSSVSLQNPAIKTASLLRCIGLPLIPQSAAVSNSNVGRLDMSWSAPVDIGVTVTGYDVYLNDSFLATTTSLSYVYTGGTKGTSYNLAVEAKSARGNSPRTTNINRQIQGIVASGGSVSTYSSGGTTYRVHQFTGGNTLTVTNAGTGWGLVVGGGGGGAAVHHGHGHGGAGGAGYHSENTSLSIPSTQGISVGGGGHGGTCCSNNGGGGGHSALGTLLSANGGSGGGRNNPSAPGGGTKNSHITGGSVNYGAGGSYGHAGGGCTHCGAGGGGSGIVIVNYPFSVP